MRFTREPGNNSWGMTGMNMVNPGNPGSSGFGYPSMGRQGNPQMPQPIHGQPGGMGYPMQEGGYPMQGSFPIQGGYPMQGHAMTPGGSIRNNLGSELKKRGIFQKDGQINNLRGGFVGAKAPKSPIETPFSFLSSGGGEGIQQMRQLILEPAQGGLAANGIASISPDNVFSCVANLPPPQSLMGSGNGTYAAYLVDDKGKSGFLAGVLRPIGTGVYQTQFRSQVPLHHYSRVMITLENPQNIGQAPQGPVVLQVKQPAGPMRMLQPMKKAGGSVWNKITGLIQKKPAAGALPEAVAPIEGAGVVPDVPGVGSEVLGSGAIPGSAGIDPGVGVNPGVAGVSPGGAGATLGVGVGNPGVVEVPPPVQ